MTPVPPLDRIERLLVVKTSSIGDVIHALPVVQAIREARPGLTLGWIVRRRCADVLRGNPWIDHLHVVADRPTLGELGRLRRVLLAEDYQCALDMQGLLLSGLMARLSGAPVRVGWDRNREGNTLWLTHPVVAGRAGDARGDTHEVDALYGFAELFGVRPVHPEFTPQSYLAADNAAEASRWLAALPCPRVALNVGASRAYKRWPIGAWAQVADGLTEAGRGVVFVGDARDAQRVEEVQGRRQGARPALDLAGKTDLRQLASVLEACDLVISGDTGPMHVAVAVGTPVVAVFGATNPRRHGPYGARNTVLRAEAGLMPPNRRPTEAEGEEAMRAVTPAQVLVAAHRKLAGA